MKMTTSSVEFRLVNNITVTIPASSLPLFQQVSQSQAPLPDTEDAQKAPKESQEIPNISSNCSFDTVKGSTNCDTAEYTKNSIIPREISQEKKLSPDDGPKKKTPKRVKARAKKEILLTHKCKECQEKFPFISKLYLHSLKNHSKQPQKSHKCYFCPGSFDEKSSLIRHVLLHGHSKVLECPDCSSLFVELKSFLEHMDNHEVLKNQPVPQEVPLLENPRTEEEVLETISDCEDAPLHSPDIQETEEIDQEQRTESLKIGKKRRKAVVQGTLEWQKRDNKNRPFTCNICNRSFTLASTLSLHTRRTHLGIRPYECAECGWKFGQSSDLTKHMRKHTGDRPYKCETCGLNFSQLRNLKVNTRKASYISQALSLI